MLSCRRFCRTLSRSSSMMRNFRSTDSGSTEMTPNKKTSCEASYAGCLQCNYFEHTYPRKPHRWHSPHSTTQYILIQIISYARFTTIHLLISSFWQRSYSFASPYPSLFPPRQADKSCIWLNRSCACYKRKSRIHWLATCRSLWSVSLFSID